MSVHKALIATLIGTSLLTFGGATARAAVPEPPTTLTVTLSPVDTNAVTSRMGDRLTFQSTIRNNGSTPINGLIAWFSLVQVDPGHEQPVDLEDWSAHKAIAVASLSPGAHVDTTWPMRLIQSGHYRVVVSAVSREERGLVPSPFVDFAVAAKPVVESSRVLPVALGIPALLVAGLIFRYRNV